MNTFTDVITHWMVLTVAAIKAEAIRLCSGPLLHVASSTLINSFYSYISPDGHNGLVWNTAPHMALWEYKGLGTKVLHAPKGKPFVIVKRGVYNSPRATMGVIFRETIRPSGKYSKPLAPMWTATRNTVLGPAGEQRRQDLGYGIGWVIVMRYIRMLEQKGYAVTIRVI